MVRIREMSKNLQADFLYDKIMGSKIIGLEFRGSNSYHDCSSTPLVVSVMWQHF